MILKNRRTREILEMEYSEFRKRFAKEIQVAFESFRKTELNKPFYNYKDDISMENVEVLNDLHPLFKSTLIDESNEYVNLLANLLKDTPQQNELKNLIVKN